MESIDELKTQGNELFKAGKFEEAVEKYSDALAIEPASDGAGDTSFFVCFSEGSRTCGQSEALELWAKRERALDSGALFQRSVACDARAFVSVAPTLSGVTNKSGARTLRDRRLVYRHMAATKGWSLIPSPARERERDATIRTNKSRIRSRARGFAH